MKTAQSAKSTAKRLHILNSSFELVLRKGFVGVGLQEILQHCGIPKGSFYHYFESKEAFGCELLQHYLTDYQQRLQPLWDNADTAQQKLLNYFQAWIGDDTASEGWAEKCLIVKLAAEVADLSEEMRLIVDTGIKRLITRLSTLIQQGLQEGSIHITAEPQAVAQVIYQMWLGAALLSKLQKDKTPLHQALHATALMLNPSHSSTPQTGQL